MLLYDVSSKTEELTFEINVINYLSWHCHRPTQHWNVEEDALYFMLHDFSYNHRFYWFIVYIRTFQFFARIYRVNKMINIFL